MSQDATMNRLQRELQRLYGLDADDGRILDPDTVGPVDVQGQVRVKVRVMVLELARPPDWAALSTVWSKVQTDLGLPAPAIAVNGSDGLQLWFSLLEPVPVPQAGTFLDALRRCYLGDVSPLRVALLPAFDTASARSPLHARPVPALQTGSDRWSAFVATDLVPIFADEPWLDVPPNPDGQAQLLESLKCIPAEEFERALQRLRPLADPAAPAPASMAEEPAAASLDPKRFLLDVMNNDSLDLALRVEAAKALRPCFEADRAQRQERDADRRS
jgi:hypothetical protein